MSPLLWVGLGGFLGSAARYLLSTLINTQSSTSFPLATFCINVVGCFVIGVIYGLSSREIIGGDMRLFLATGICGGFTTFSAFSAECFVLLRDGNYTLAGSYIIASVVCGVFATIGGLWITKSL